MKENFDRCFELLLKDEGGYVNDPVDPGGETNMGISKKAYPSEDIRGMTKDRAKMIYKRDYWSPIRGDDLPLGLDYAVFDAAVNSGVPRSTRWLQQMLGVNVDGKIGPVTLSKAKEVSPSETIDKFCDTRLSFLKGLSTWWKYKNGWTTRVEGVRETSKRMTKEIPVVSPAPSTKRSVFPFLLFLVFVAAAAYFIFGG